jgi:hypothetical protein
MDPGREHGGDLLLSGSAAQRRVLMYKLYRFKTRFFLFSWLLFCAGVMLYPQEALKSVEEEYYDFLALQGITERPTLNYRTLSDSVWTIPTGAGHPWEDQNLGAPRYFFDNKLKLKIYGPELFNSVNTAAPYGQNDGALWQGKGYNGSFTGGARLEMYGFELTFKPQAAFSQNFEFEYIQPNPAYSGYTGKAVNYGYYGVPSIDAPQRFGNEPFFIFDWGDSEIRYTWKTLTVGFGTQAIWLGPAQINPIIHSNNAPSYPKLDIGLRRQSMTLPWLNWYIGDIETRAWWGYLSESDYFDNDSSNDHNLITGFSIAYQFPFLKNLSIGLNRIMLSKWKDLGPEPIFTLLWPFMSNDAGSDNNDQRASIIFDYLLPIAQLNIYLECARNDYSPTLDHIIRYPFHTEAYTLGIKKSLTINYFLQGEILLELTSLECSKDYDRVIAWYSTFYAHHIIIQGHTNGGQWLGSGNGTGGNSQYLGFKLYFTKGFTQLFVQRRNPDLDYTWYIDSKKNPTTSNTTKYIAESNIRAFLDFGFSALYYINQNFFVTNSIILRDEHNPLNESLALVNGSMASIHRYNVYINLGLQYIF